MHSVLWGTMPLSLWLYTWPHVHFSTVAYWRASGCHSGQRIIGSGLGDAKLHSSSDQPEPDQQLCCGQFVSALQLVDDGSHRLHSQFEKHIDIHRGARSAGEFSPGWADDSGTQYGSRAL